MWINRSGIVNLISIPQLEENGYHVKYNTPGYWCCNQPTGGRNIESKLDTGTCNKITYIDIHKSQNSTATIQTIRNNFVKFTNIQVERAILTCKIQAVIGYPIDIKFK